VAGLVSEQTKTAYKQETTVRKQLEAMLQQAEADRAKLLQRLQTLQHSKHLHVAHQQQSQDQTAAQTYVLKLRTHIEALKVKIELVLRETQSLQQPGLHQELQAKA
jgi:hypothetical protein